MKKINIERARKVERLAKKYIHKFGYSEAYARRKANEYPDLAERMKTKTLHK